MPPQPRRAATRTADVESRSLPVPDGLDGTRVDAALAKMLGFSRTFAAEVADAGGVAMDGRVLDEVRPAPRRRLARGVVGAEGGARVVPRRGARPRDRLRRRRHRGRRQARRRRRAPLRRLGGPDRARRTRRGRLPHRDDRRRRAAGRRAPPRRRHERAHGRRQDRAAPTRRSSAPSRSARSRRSTTRSCRGIPIRSPAPSTRPIGRHPTHSWKFAVTPDGKDSVTHYETLEAFPGASLLEIHLETGRTHQIRVHMAAHRHPCVGDPLYGGDPTLSARLGLTRQWLHAHELSFAHPRDGGVGDLHVASTRPTSPTRSRCCAATDRPG